MQTVFKYKYMINLTLVTSTLTHNSQDIKWNHIYFFSLFSGITYLAERYSVGQRVFRLVCLKHLASLGGSLPLDGVCDKATVQNSSSPSHMEKFSISLLKRLQVHSKFSKRKEKQRTVFEHIMDTREESKWKCHL